MANNIAQKTPIILAGEDLPIIWVNEFDEGCSTEFSRDLVRLESDPETTDIFIYINSFGGNVFSLLSMVDLILACRKPIHTVGTGICASSGAVLLACGTGTRWIAKNSYMHIHHIQSGMHGDTPEREQDLKQVKFVEDRMFTLLTMRSKLTKTKLIKKLQEEKGEWQLSASEAIKCGFADKIGIPSFNKYMVTEYMS